ncbi:MAG TPA: hypothetical protein VF861_07025 [Telluria sp.]
MFGSGILDTILGLIFVFLLVSMLVTISNELIAGALRSRARWLRIGIERLLGTSWAQDLYAHPLIGGATQSSDSDSAGTIGPSYIASRSFANVLMTLLHDSAGSVKEVRRTLQSVITTATDGGATVDTLKARVSDALPHVRALVVAHSHAALAEAITKDLTALGERLKAPYTVADAQADIQRLIDGMQSRYLRQMIEGLPDERMRKVLLALFEDAQNDVEKFKENIEIWFNNSMDRISGWYKRRSQWVVAGLAVTAAVSMNVDAVLIVKHLQTYPGARESLVAQAKAFAERTPATVTAGGAGMHRVTSGDDYKGVLTFAAPAASAGTVKLSSDTAGVTLQPATMEVKRGDRQVEFHVRTVFSDTPATATISAAGAAGGSAQLDVREGLPAQFSAVQEKLADLGLPIGWVWEATPTQVKNGQAIPRSVGAGVDRVLQHFLGWFITALAATLGAPFWFDMLNRVISIRSTGKAPEEKPKAPKEVSTPVEPGQTPREADRAAAGR